MPQFGSESFTCGSIYLSDTIVVPDAFLRPGFDVMSGSEAV